MGRRALIVLLAALAALSALTALSWGGQSADEGQALTPRTRAAVTASVRLSEVQVNPQGQAHTDRGYFTAVAERHGGEWTFRDVHWSSAVPQAQE